MNIKSKSRMNRIISIKLPDCLCFPDQRPDAAYVSFHEKKPF